MIMNFVGPLWRLQLTDLLPSRWPVAFPKARKDRCRCGHPKYMHRPLLRTDGTREDLGDEEHAIDPCTFVGCGCGYYEESDVLP